MCGILLRERLRLFLRPSRTSVDLPPPGGWDIRPLMLPSRHGQNTPIPDINESPGRFWMAILLPCGRSRVIPSASRPRASGAVILRKNQHLREF